MVVIPLESETFPSFCIPPFFKSCCPGTGGGILASCRVNVHRGGELGAAPGASVELLGVAVGLRTNLA